MTIVASISSIGVFKMTPLYYLHEKTWNNISFVWNRYRTEIGQCN